MDHPARLFLPYPRIVMLFLAIGGPALAGSCSNAEPIDPTIESKNRSESRFSDRAAEEGARPHSAVTNSAAGVTNSAAAVTNSADPQRLSSFEARLAQARLPAGCTALGRPDPIRCDHFIMPPADPQESPQRKAGIHKDRNLRSRPLSLLYLNFDGGHLEAGNDDPAQGTSTVMSLQGVSAADFPPFDHTAYYDLDQFASRSEALHAVAGIVRGLFAPFDVEVVIEEPPSTVPYSMVMISGDVSLLNLPTGVLGVAPMDCNDSNPRNIPFVFAEEMGNMKVLALTIAHEVGHSYGLVHVDDTEAIMNPYQASQDAYWLSGQIADDPACGGGSSQDSYAVLGENLGWRVTNGMPWVELVRPREGAVLASLNDALIQTADESIVERIELAIDGEVVNTIEWPEMLFTFSNQAPGPHTLEVTAWDSEDHDGQIQSYTTTVAVTVDPECGSTGSCSAGLASVGQPCETGGDCATGICVEQVDTGIRVCSKSCSEESPCPWPISASADGVQWTRCLCDESATNCCVPEPENCGDGLDNDCDGLVDCVDPECEGGRMCTDMEVCTNEIDDDVDGLTDCDDPDCMLASGCGCIAETEICDNGLDDDCDGKIDCADPDCGATDVCASGQPEPTRYCGLGDEPLRVYTTSGKNGGGGAKKLQGCSAASHPTLPSSPWALWLLFALGLAAHRVSGRRR